MGIGGVAYRVRDDLNPIECDHVGSADEALIFLDDIAPARVRT